MPLAGEIVRASDVADTWTDYTPTVTNATATAEGRYIEAGKMVTVHFLIEFTGTASGTILLELPIDAAYPLNTRTFGTCVMIDTSGGARSYGTIFPALSDAVAFGVDATGLTAIATVPFTWASGDKIGGTLTYEAL